MIVVVDDDNDIREVVCQALRDEGYSTIEASNGREAIELLQTMGDRPQLILLDLMMPVMDGWEFLMGIDEDPLLHRIPVALMTAHPSVKRAFDKQDDEVASTCLLLPKPIDMQRLLAIVQNVCDGPARHGPTS
jgi:CheY-like chemotaxis protein